MVAYAYNLRLQRWMQKDQGFKASLSYIENLRSAWAPGGHGSDNNDNKATTKNQPKMTNEYWLGHEGPDPSGTASRDA